MYNWPSGRSSLTSLCAPRRRCDPNNTIRYFPAAAAAAIANAGGGAAIIGTAAPAGELAPGPGPSVAVSVARRHIAAGERLTCDYAAYAAAAAAAAAGEEPGPLTLTSPH